LRRDFRLEKRGSQFVARYQKESPVIKPNLCSTSPKSTQTDPETSACAPAKSACCAGSSGETAPASQPEPQFETVRIEKITSACSLCDDYARKHAAKPVVVMSCEGACLRGEISRQAANHLCHVLAPEKTVRLCLGGAFTKDTGQRALVRNAPRVLALEGCSVRCASRMMRGHLPDMKAEVIITEALCDFDRSLFGIEELPATHLRDLGRAVAERVAVKI
jgi:uncharacterized metal-binding protein